MAPFPTWLPTPIAAHARRLLDSGGLDDASKARLLALTCDPGMQRVWCTLSRATPDDAALVEFLDQVRLHASVQGLGSAWPALSPAQQRKAFRTIAQHASLLLKELEHLAGPNGQAESGLAELEAALRRAAGASASKSWNAALVGALWLRENLEQTEEVSLVAQLRALVEAAQMAAATPAAPGPRKRKAGSAARTAYVQDLASFVRLRFGKPFHQAVATTVNISLALYDDQVSADLVRRLSEPSRKITRTTRT